VNELLEMALSLPVFLLVLCRASGIMLTAPILSSTQIPDRVKVGLTSTVIGLGGVQKVLQNLLAEGIPITDLGGILEAIADHAATTKDPVHLTELVRKSIARTICATVESRGNIGAITLDPSLERLIAQCIHEGGSGTAVILDPSRAEQLIRKVAAAVRDTVAGGFEAVLLTSSPIRRHVRRMVQHAVPELPVLAYDELVPAMRLEGRATVSLDE